MTGVKQQQENSKTATDTATQVDALVSKFNEIEAKEKKALNDIVRPLTLEKIAIKQEITELKCPAKVGETWTDGKDKYLITGIKPGYLWDFKLVGRKIKKNGEPGKDTRELWRFTNKCWSAVSC